MFQLFKKKSALDKLHYRYRALLEEAHRLSAVNRKASDAKMAEANDILKQIEQLDVKNSNA